MIAGTRVFGSHFMVGGSVEPLTATDMEEGEASCYYKKNGGGDVVVDPDVTLAYIDKKIERILGHFQKEFESGFSAENLGSKYGGYGSFLPTYERPPSILTHQKKQGESNAAPFPDNAPLEGSSLNPKAPPPQRLEATVCNTISSQYPRETSGSSSGRVDSCFPSTKVSNSCPSKVEADSKVNCSLNKRSLKFRIKIGYDSAGLKNAAIYSGLGLDDSPFSSSDNSSDASEGILPVSQCPPDGSPTKIIEAMTTFPVPHEALISPLHDSLLELPRKEKLYRETKPLLSLIDKKDGLAKLNIETNSTLVKKEKKEVEHREMKVKRQNEVCYEVCASLGKEKTVLVNGKSENDAFESKNFLSNELQSKPVSEGTKAKANLDVQKKKLSHKATLHIPDTQKGSIKKEKPEIVGKKKLEVPLTAGGKIVRSVDKDFEFRSEALEALKCRNDTDSDTPESDNRRRKLKLHSNQKVRASNKDSFNSSRLDENRKSKDVIERASGDLQKVKIVDHSEIRMPKSSTVEPEAVALVDNWVLCDSCGKWRLLPYGEKPQLPEKWSCSMLNWLPGMNLCDISEEETTAKLNALYQLPLPQSEDFLQNNANVLSSGGASKERKKKETSKEIQNPVSTNNQTLVKSSQKNQQLQSRKYSSLNNGLSNASNQLRNSMKQSSSDLHNLVEGKSRGQLKEKSIVRGGEGDIGLKKHSKLNMANKMQIPLKKQGETAEIISVNQVSDKSSKKRKLKDWQDIKNYYNSTLHVPVVSKEESCERLTKKKKCDVSDDFTGGIEKICRDKEPKMQNKKMIHKKTSVGKELLKRYIGVRQVSGAANSSTSNAQSHLTKAEFQVKVSSAESVSSASIRTSIDQLRLCNHHTDNSMEPSHKKRKKVFLDKEFCNLTSTEKEKSVLSDVELDMVKASDGMSKRLKKSMKYEPEVDSYHVAPLPDGVGEIEQNIPRKHSTKLTKKEKIHVGAEELKFPQNLKGHDGEDQKSGALLQSNRAVRLQLKQCRESVAGNKGVLSTVNIGECKEEPSHLGVDADTLRVSSKAGDSHQLIVNAPKSDDVVESKTLRDLGNDGNASNLDATKSSNQTACITLKEAKKLRDGADNLKNAGFIFESNELYFQSALKYLHGAFLLETLNNASGKHGDITHLQYYGITAELCEICALEYERCGEMVTAALAFKCIEVANLKIVYHKHSSIDGDRLEMQSLFRTIVQGESPSSSASDVVDNLSNQGALDKATCNKVGGGYIWNPANCTSLARILDFTRDMNSAMDASRRSRNAFLAAASSCAASEGKHVDNVASVKKVIDFSFQDVGELVQLVRVATQTITHSSFRSARD